MLSYAFAIFKNIILQLMHVFYQTYEVTLYVFS